MLLHLGNTPTIIVSSEDITREVLKTHDLIFASRPLSSVTQKLAYGCGDVAFAPYGKYWRQARKICVVHMLSLKRVKSFQFVRDEEISLFIKKIHESHDGLVNLSEMIGKLSNDIVCRATFGKKCFGEGEECNFGETLMEYAYLLGSFPIGDFIPWLGWVDWLRGLDARVRNNFKEIDAFLDKVFEEHLRNNVKAEGECINFVDVMLSLDDMDGISISRDNMKAIVLDMFSGGIETTTSTINWAMAELIKNPEAMKRAQEEIKQIIKHEGIITEESIDRMKYLKAVIKETLRLHPPLPLLVPHASIQDVKLCGYDIPARTTVMINAWAIGRDPKSWERPEEFDPQRFINYDIDFKGQDSFNLIPFGAGRRICPGIGFAMAIIELVLTRLLHHFEWELPNGMKREELDMSESPGIVEHKRSGLLLVAKCQYLP